MRKNTFAQPAMVAGAFNVINAPVTALLKMRQAKKQTARIAMTARPPALSAAVTVIPSERCIPQNANARPNWQESGGCHYEKHVVRNGDHRPAGRGCNPVFNRT